MFLLTICVIVLVNFCYLVFWRYENSKYMKNMAGPKPNFFLGNVVELFFVPKERRFNHLMKILEDYGPNVKIFAGPVRLCLATADVTLIEFILNSNKLIDKSEFYEFTHSWLGTGLLTSTGTKWKNRRRMLTQAFHFSLLESFVQIFDNVGNVFITKLDGIIDKASVDVFPLVTACTLDIICEAAMGTKLNAQDDKNAEYVKSVKTMCNIFMKRLTSPFHPVLYPLQIDYYREKRALKVIHHHTENIINKRLAQVGINENVGVKKKSTLLDILLDCPSLSMEDIREEVDTFMFAGHDTTATALSFALYCLAMNPEVQKKAYLEQKTMFGEDNKAAKPTMAQLQEMKYLEMVIKETLRLYPPVPLVGRKFPMDEDIVWDGNHFPKGLEVLLLVYAIHRNPKYFSDPLTFSPERFESTNAYSAFVFAPFSAGPRNCIGQKFAMLEMKSLISKVLRNFVLLPSNPVHEPQLVPNVVLHSINGVCLSLRKRV